MKTETGRRKYDVCHSSSRTNSEKITSRI